MLNSIKKTKEISNHNVIYLPGIPVSKVEYLLFTYFLKNFDISLKHNVT